MSFKIDYTPMGALADLAMRSGKAEATKLFNDQSLRAQQLAEQIANNRATEANQAMSTRGMLARLYNDQQMQQAKLANDYAIAEMNANSRSDVASQNNQTR